MPTYMVLAETFYQAPNFTVALAINSSHDQNSICETPIRQFGQFVTHEN